MIGDFLSTLFGNLSWPAAGWISVLIAFTAFLRGTIFKEFFDTKRQVKEIRSKILNEVINLMFQLEIQSITQAEADESWKSIEQLYNELAPLDYKFQDYYWWFSYLNVRRGIFFEKSNIEKVFKLSGNQKYRFGSRHFEVEAVPSQRSKACSDVILHNNQRYFNFRFRPRWKQYWKYRFHS